MFTAINKKLRNFSGAFYYIDIIITTDTSDVLYFL